MLCPTCRGETPADKPFCANCGASLTSSCASCGAELLAGKPFCADCGAPVASTPVADGAATAHGGELGAERRLCSILFVDLVGFTPLAEKADPEAVRELLSHYFERAEAIVSSYGGTIEKFIGDAVMAVWGAPVANEDDAERAVRAGLDVVASVTDLGRALGREGLAARAGVVTGEVAVTVGKVAEGMVLGDTVNAASRVQGAAEPGTVLVDEATWHASSGAIAYAEVGELTLKGKTGTLAAWRALRVVGQRKGLGRAERLEPPFVGRDDELRLVKDLLSATARERRARLVSVTGVPGIGKSRLAWEFLKYVDGLAETVYWHQGHSANYGEGVTFGALGEMVRMRAGINEAEDADSSRAKLAASVAEYVADDDERRWIEPRLAHLLGLAEAPTGDREELFSAWRTFFERIAELGVTVLVFEDLQWADPGQIDYIESILEWSRSHPIMVVTLSRPELRDRRPDWGAGQRSFTSLHLDALSDEAMAALLDGFVHGLPPGVSAKVRERAEGVPLYAVETVRMLVDRGVLVADGGAYRVDGELSTLEIPETLHALVASRLDALPVEQRSLLQDAAILGATFPPATLAAVYGHDRDGLESMLRDLVRKEFLAFDSDPRSPERGQYRFVQGVISDVALSMLARRDRSAKHLAAARHFEALGDEELTAVVAAQYASALRAAPDADHNEELVRRAIEWLTRAGSRARTLGSPEEALDLFDQALAVTPPGSEHAALLRLAGDAAADSNDGVRSEALLGDAIAEYEGAGDRDGVRRASARLADVLGQQRRYTEAIELAQPVLDALDDDEVEVRLQLANTIAMCLSQGKDPATSLEWAEIALTLAERQGDVAALARALGTRSLALFNLGRHREAVMLGRGMVALASDAGALREQGVALMGLGLYALPDDPRESIRASLESAEVARRGGHRQMENTNLLNAAETAITLGDWAAARHLLEELTTRGHRDTVWTEQLRAMLEAMTGETQTAIDRLAALAGTSDTSEFVAGQTTDLHASAVVHLAAGDLEGAQRLAAESVALDPLGINAPVSVHVQGRAALWRRDLEGAQQALAAGQALRGRWMSAVNETLAAGIAALEGRLEEAAERYAAALEVWRALDDTLSLALCDLDMVLLLGDANPSTVAGKEAEDVFTQLGAVPFLDRLTAAKAGREEG
ncbi:MAG TPA: adenylate/guanylate cyclase domain-containing protein [Acidimicrobiales bacterium]|jgi:class 3 adenylate cyclase/tetratricopeptide (TPR) repeat protein|nr:adenylate/guanylate cyclase domain-containing protein [Acidimicrobiales bacterium]